MQHFPLSISKPYPPKSIGYNLIQYLHDLIDTITYYGILLSQMVANKSLDLLN